MELKSFPFESTDKYLSELNHELAGRSFRVLMDDGEERLYSFVTGSAVLLGLKAKPMKWYEYKCLKADDQTYMAAIELADEPVRTCSTLILDLENNLVTEVLTKVGSIPSMPRRAVTSYQFGAIAADDRPLTRKRHGYTDELVGLKVNWYYSTGFVNTHLYYHPMYYRCQAYYIPDSVSGMVAEDLKTGGKKEIPEFFTDEEARYIRIKNGMYLISFMEDNINRRDPLSGGSNLLILYNMKEGFNVGRAYNLDHDQKPVFGMFRAYADITDTVTGLEDLPSPYRV